MIRPPMELAPDLAPDLAQDPDRAGSLWEATAEPGPELTPVSGHVRTKVCVVGAGFAGLSTALHLAERGEDVVVVDRFWPGYGASGRNGGQVLPGLKWLPDELARKLGDGPGGRLAAFTSRTPELVYGIMERHGIVCGLRRGCGWLNAASTEAAAAMLRNRAAQFSARGLPVRFLENEEASRLLGTTRYRGALLDERAGAINPLSYARGLAAAAVRCGARVFIRSPALSLERIDQAWRLTTPGGTVVADTVVLATNAYTDRLWPGLRQEVIPINSLQSATVPLPASLRSTILPGNHVVSDTQRILLYFRYDDAGRLVMGGRGSLGERNRDGLFRFVERAALRLFPQLRGIEWEFRWAGKVALTVDQLPRLHELAPGLIATLGCNGRGVGLASGMGQVVADWIGSRDAEASPVPVTALRPIPFHSLRRPALEAMAAWARLRDTIG